MSMDTSNTTTAQDQGANDKELADLIAQNILLGTTFQQQTRHELDALTELVQEEALEIEKTDQIVAGIVRQGARDLVRAKNAINTLVTE